MKLGGMCNLIGLCLKLENRLKKQWQTNLNEFAAYLCLFIELRLLSTVFKEIHKEVYEKVS